jgi:hypothetical protein
MSRKAIFCLATSPQHAEKMIYRLKNRGFHSRAVSALFSDGTVDPDASGDPEVVPATPVPNQLGGEFAWLPEIGRGGIPGYIAAGPIVRAIKQAEGAAVSRIGRGLVGLGLPETEAKSYQRKIKRGSVLISYHTEHTDEITRAQGVLETAGGQDFIGTDESVQAEHLSALSVVPAELA